MPYFSQRTVNRPFNTAQHYRRTVIDWGESERHLHHALQPTSSYFEAGSCAGMALSWIRRVHTTGNLTTLPHPTESTILQYRTEFPRGSRQYAYDRDASPDSDVLEDLHRSALEREPSGTAIRRNFLHAYRAAGLHSIYRGKFKPKRLASSLFAHGPAAEPRTYLLTAQGHATALAVVGRNVAFFDPNRGIATVPLQRTTDIWRLRDDYLLDWVRKGRSDEIAVTELSYFKGVNRRHYRFGPNARPVERGGSMWDDTSEDAFAFLADLWGGIDS